jgi:hypothetical protein
MSEKIDHLLELCSHLEADLGAILKSAEVGPRACRRTVRQYHRAIVKTLLEMKSVLGSNDIGKMLP